MIFQRVFPFVYLFTNTIAEKISSNEVRSIIIQLSGSPESYEKSREFLKFFFSKVSFKKLKCLMLCGVELSNDFSQEIGTLNLDVFHMRNFRYRASLAKHDFFYYCYSLNTLYVVHANEDQPVYPPGKLKKFAMYCPKSSKNMIDGCKLFYTESYVNVDTCHDLKEM